MNHALRSLAKSPGFTGVVVLTLTLGIGATTALFSIVNAVLLQPLPYREADRIVTVHSRNLQTGGHYQVSGADFRDWHERSRSFTAFAKYQSGDAAAVTAKTAEKLRGALVAPEFFAALEVAPLVGRLFTADEAKTGGVAVVGEAFARRHFGDEIARALDADIKLWGRTFRVVGVLPTWCTFPQSAEVWLPIDTLFPENSNRTAHNYRVIARLRPGVSLEQAQGEIDAIAARVALQYPDSNANKGASLVPLHAGLVSRHRAMLWTMLGAVALVLLIACANVANLMLARGAQRGHEMAVRAALGASRARIARQLLTESFLLAGAGGAAGVLLASWGLAALLALVPAGIPRLDEVALDGGTLLFATAVSLVACLVTGLFPAMQAMRTDLKSALHAGGRGTTHARGRLRSALVVAQLAVSLMLLTGAGLLFRSFQQLTSVDPGYDPRPLLVMEASYPAAGAASARRAIAFYEEVARQAAALPGVAQVSYTGSLPIDALGSNGYYEIEGRPTASRADREKRHAVWRVVGPGYFSTLRIPVRRGREIDASDAAQATATVVINESFARVAWPGEDPLGRRIRIGWDNEGQWMTIVGVVADTGQGSLDRAISQELYVPAAQHPSLAADMKVVARSVSHSDGRPADPMPLARDFRRIALSLNPEVPVSFTTAELLVANTIAPARFRSLLLLLFAGVALLIAAVGLYSVIAYTVAQRTTEFGIRMALGAQRWHVNVLVLRGGAIMVTLGIALGLSLSAATGRVLQAFLFQVPLLDPLVYTAVVALFAAIAIAACLLPAHRAARVDPLIALRTE